MSVTSLNICLLEPFFSGSHQHWAEGLKRHSRHRVNILSLKGRHWKWRMYGGAVALAGQFNQLKERPDLILATDMLDLTTFLALTRQQSAGIPVAMYFHENQITYPWSPDDKDVALGRNNQYGFINYTSALAADQLYFNSSFHKTAFVEALTPFLSQFPDQRGLENVNKIKAKSQTLYLGMDLQRFDVFKKERKQNEQAVLLWNHRWEYDKNPSLFFESLFKLKEENIPFQLIVVGESYRKSPAVFTEAKKRLSDEIIYFGYADGFEQYARLLCQADVLPVTSRQDFFGGSVVEGIYVGCVPLLPNRLAYPEHLSVKNNPANFYREEKDFYDALKKIVLEFNNSVGRNSFYDVRRYDWEVGISSYESTFERLLKP